MCSPWRISRSPCSSALSLSDDNALTMPSIGPAGIAARLTAGALVRLRSGLALIVPASTFSASSAGPCAEGIALTPYQRPPSGIVVTTVSNPSRLSKQRRARTVPSFAIVAWLASPHWTSASTLSASSGRIARTTPRNRLAVAPRQVIEKLSAK